eukprot:6974484-Pyramimonas_sp.AAC.1
MEYVWSWCWRRNHVGEDLMELLGSQFHRPSSQQRARRTGSSASPGLVAESLSLALAHVTGPSLLRGGAAAARFCRARSWCQAGSGAAPRRHFYRCGSASMASTRLARTQAADA